MRLIDADAFAEWVHKNVPVGSQEALLTKSFVMAALKSESVTPTIRPEPETPPARVLSYDEVRDTCPDPVYIEKKNGLMSAALIYDAGESDKRLAYFSGGLNRLWIQEWAEYGSEWRCWTARPRERERKATRWEEAEVSA